MNIRHLLNFEKNEETNNFFSTSEKPEIPEVNWSFEEKNTDFTENDQCSEEEEQIPNEHLSKERENVTNPQLNRDPYLDNQDYWRKQPRITDTDVFIPNMVLDDNQKIRFYGQLEVAAGCLYQLFLQLHKSPETKFDHITQEVLSKNIQGLMKWNEIYNNQTNTLFNSPVNEDGSITHDHINKKIKRLEAIGIIAWFLGEIDMHGKNFGVIDLINKFRAQKFDHGKTFADLESEIDLDDILKIFSAAREDYFIGYCYTSFPKEITEHRDSMTKRYKMVRIICETDFNLISKIIHDNIDHEFLPAIKQLIELLKERHVELQSQYYGYLAKLSAKKKMGDSSQNKVSSLTKRKIDRLGEDEKSFAPECKQRKSLIS